MPVCLRGTGATKLPRDNWISDCQVVVMPRRSSIIGSALLGNNAHSSKTTRKRAPGRLGKKEMDNISERIQQSVSANAGKPATAAEAAAE